MKKLLRVRQLNAMGKGMYPLNYCSKLVKEASDIMFSVALNDRISVEVRIRMLEGTIADFKKCINYKEKESDV